MLASPNIFSFSHGYPIGDNSFSLPGLGKPGLTCGVNRMSHFSADGSAVKYSPLSCGRIECPTCWTDWARRTVFSLAMRIEAYARLDGRRPSTCIFSVAAQRVFDEGWTWDRITRGLFRRGYRRSKKVGVDGGLAIFHPYRVRPSIKRELRQTGEHATAGIWKQIRARVNAGEPFEKFARLGPHVHAVVFGDPRAHVSKDFVINFNDDDNGIPRTLSSSKEVVAFLFYLITHTGILTHLRQYPAGVHRRATHTVRAFGSLHRLDPKDALDPVAYDQLAREIAGLIGMAWVQGELVYPASVKEFDTPDDGIEWIPIYKLGSYLQNDAWLTSLSHSQCTFWLFVLRTMKLLDRPPDLGVIKDFAVPSDITVYTIDQSAIE